MNTILSNIGLCRKAGFLITGFDAVIKEANSEKSKLIGILVASDISEKTLKELRFKTKGNEIIKLSATKNEIESVLTKSVAIIGITNKGFYDKLKS